MTEQTFDNWRKRLAGESVPAHEGHAEPGYYRIRKKDLATNRVYWTPVTYFVDGGKLVGVIGNRDMTDNEVGDLWAWVCAYPIPEAIYFQFDGRVEVPNEEWPKAMIGEPKRPPFASAAKDIIFGDDAFRGDIPAANRQVARSDNLREDENISLDMKHRADIQAAIGAAPKAVPVNAEQLAVVEGSKNRIAELRLAADKVGKSIYDPIFRQYKAEQTKWAAIVADATTEEKRLGKLVLTFRENERQRIAKEHAAAAAKQREIEEANQRAADRAIAAGKPEPAPVVDPAPVIAPIAAAPTYGTRTTKAEVKTILDEITDYDAVYQYFKAEHRVQELLLALATNAVKAGRVVPGTKTHEGII
jgi:hypothetical protein